MQKQTIFHGLQVVTVCPIAWCEKGIWIEKKYTSIFQFIGLNKSSTIGTQTAVPETGGSNRLKESFNVSFEEDRI